MNTKLLSEGYIHAPNFLERRVCDALTDGLKDLVATHQTIKDPQCPKSEAIYGAEVFDSLLAQMKSEVELISGKRLLPTYSYARLYAFGDELHNHTDRPACQISATVTLGFEGSVWPIYMGDDINKSNPSRIDMKVGDAVLYLGMEKHHWREKYTEGQWQAQVFLHYVDADGPYKDWVFDGRGRLNITAN
jgi:hypothetical protein